MPELDHLVFASPDLGDGIKRIERLTGARAMTGGSHPGVGTRNALLALDEVTYFEVIAIDPHQPAPDRRRPFGLDDADRPRLAGYAIHPTGDETIEGIAAEMRGLGFEPGEIAAMSRTKPDGDELRWRLTRLGGRSSDSADGSLPFIIDWGGTESPAAALPRMGSLVSLCVCHPDSKVRAAVSALGVGAETANREPKLVAVIDTVRGRVELS